MAIEVPRATIILPIGRCVDDPLVRVVRCLALTAIDVIPLAICERSHQLTRTDTAAETALGASG